MLMGAAVLSASAQTDFRHISFDEALTAAKQENKLIFIDFYTTWCGPCKMMSNKVFPQKNVGDFMNAKFIPLKMDAEKEGLELAKKYAVKAYPTYIILNAQGKEEARFTGAMEGDVFINKVNASLDPEQKPERLKARYEAGDRTPELVNTYAMQHFEKRDEKGRFKVIDDYYNSLSDADRIKDENIFIFTRYTFDFDSERTRFMVDHIKDFSKASASSVGERLADIYKTELGSYFSGYKRQQGLYDENAYNKLKKEMNDLGFNNDGKFTPAFEFIEQRGKMNDTEFLAYCENKYDNFSQNYKELLVMNLPRLFDIENPTTAANICKFIRNRIAKMSPVCIQMAGRTLGSIEK